MLIVGVNGIDAFFRKMEDMLMLIDVKTLNAKLHK